MRVSRSIAAGASATLLLLGVSGCVGGDQEGSGPVGPNGYQHMGTLDGVDVDVWYDYAEDAELSDIVLTHDGDIVGLCLGDAGTRCTEGDANVQAYIVMIGPAAAVRADLQWAGETIAMTAMNEGIEDERAHLFVAAPPVLPEGTLAGTQVTLFDEADQPL